MLRALGSNLIFRESSQIFLEIQEETSPKHFGWMLDMLHNDLINSSGSLKLSASKNRYYKGTIGFVNWTTHACPYGRVEKNEGARALRK